MPPRLPELVRRARRLAQERDRLVDELAREWSAALRGQGLSATDLDELWAGLTEDAVRRLRHGAIAGVTHEAARRETQEVLRRVRARVESELAAGG